VPTELVSCPACGRKNASDRTTCLSCSGSLAASEESPPPSETQFMGEPMTEPLLERVERYIKNFTLEQATKLAILSSVLLVAFSVFYYLVIYMPHKEAALLKLQKEEQVAKELKEAQEKSARESEAAMNEARLNMCLSDTREDYENNWANSCKAGAERQQRGLQDCLNSGLDRNYCSSVWRAADGGPNCSLPRETARRWNDSLKEAKNECYKKYPQR